MIRMFFGSPGSGKTTLAAKIVKKDYIKVKGVPSLLHKREASPCVVNFKLSLDNSYFVDISHLAEYYPPSGCRVVVDESGIVFNNRSFKTLHKGFIEYFKLHRHNKNDIDFFSQSYEDTDITIRRLTDEFWYVFRVGPLTIARRYFYQIKPDKESGEIKQKFYTRSILWQLLPNQPKQFMFCFRPLYYKYFDSWDLPPRPFIELPKRDNPIKPKYRQKFKVKKLLKKLKKSKFKRQGL